MPGFFFSVLAFAAKMLTLAALHHVALPGMEMQ